MIIVGAGGFAGELYDLLQRIHLKTAALAFYDDVTPQGYEHGLLNVLRNQDEARKHFDLGDNRFVLGLGGIAHRARLIGAMEIIGGVPMSLISANSFVSRIDTAVGAGTVVLDYVSIAQGVTIGNHALISQGVSISHQCKLGFNVELYPGARILGKAQIGNNVHIGANAVVASGVVVGSNVEIASGAIVSSNVPNNQRVMR